MDYHHYKGYEYSPYEEVEFDGENMKIFHYCFKDGKEVKMVSDFYNESPYRFIDYSKFVQYIDSIVDQELGND